MAALWALRALGWLKSAWFTLTGVVMRYPWQAACVGLLLACAWLWHGKGVVERREAAEKAAYAAAIAQQNAAIAQWQAAGKAMQAKGAAALATVQQANRPMIEAARYIERVAPAPVVQADCRTPPEVMAAKEQL